MCYVYSNDCMMCLANQCPCGTVHKICISTTQFTVKLGQEDAEVSPLCNHLLNLRFLFLEVILLAQKSGHAACVILKGTNWQTSHFHFFNIEPALFEHLLEPLCLTGFCGHLLWLPADLRAWVIHQDHLSLCFLCFPPLDLFISNARSTSGASDACADE